jgi:2'-5' RNA ligase
MPRLFIAIDMPEQVQDQISDLYTAIQGARWVPHDQLHITMRFIGETDTATETSIIASLEHIRFEPFHIAVKSTGFFPLRKDPQVLWVGIDNSPELENLQRSIERSLTALGINPDSRVFHPHVTVARLDRPHKDRVVQFITDNHLFKTEPFEIDEFHLYRSYLGKNGAQYVKEASFEAGIG